MGVRTVTAYLQSLRDGRTVYIQGQKVADVTTHPLLAKALQHVRMVFELAGRPDLQDLLTYIDERGERHSRFYQIPRSAQDLILRRDAIEECTRQARGLLAGNFATDAIFALIQAATGPNNAPRWAANVRNFYEYARRGDLLVSIAMSDVKGDRSRHPLEQDDPDYYLHVVEERPDGIVVRGAKAHISAAALVDELIVLPTKAMGPAEKDYAVAFAVPVATPGLKVVCRPTWSEGRSPFDHPVSATRDVSEALVIFDDVFVPRDRIFLKGETHLAAPVAHALGLWQRFSGIAYKGPLADLMVGAAFLVAEFNGVVKAGSIQDKLFELILFADTLRAYAKAAALDCIEMESGITVPNPLLANIGKFQFANEFHRMVRNLQDICGGLLASSPTEADFHHPDLKKYLHKYLGTRKEVPAALRMRVMNLVKDLTASEYGGHLQVMTLHGEGSMSAQRISTVRSYDATRAKRLALAAAGVTEEQST